MGFLTRPTPTRFAGLLALTLMGQGCGNWDAKKKPEAGDVAGSLTGEGNLERPDDPIDQQQPESQAPNEPGTEPPETRTDPAIDLVLPTTRGATLRTREDGGRATVILFAQDTCLVCIEEVRTLKAARAADAALRARVNMISVLVGAILEDAGDWEERHDLPWPVTYDEELAVFSRFFPIGTRVPAAVIAIPGRGVVLVEAGELSVARLKDVLIRHDYVL